MASAYTAQDLLITTNGDLVVTAAGDLQVATIDQTTLQNVTLNLYTQIGDFAALPYLGSMLDDFIGQPNTRSTATLVQSEVIRALTTNGQFNVNDITAQIVPVDYDTIAAYISIQNSAGITNQTYVFIYSYINGLSLAS